MSTFSVQIEKFLEKFADQSTEVFKETVSLVGDRLVDRSPVGDPTTWEAEAPAGYQEGGFKGNWQLGVNSSPEGVLETKDPHGNETKGLLKGAAAGLKYEDTAHFVNNVPYAEQLENGWSKQAPSGVVKVTSLEFKDLVAQALENVKK